MPHLLLIDIGNTHTHLGLANGRKVLRHSHFPTLAWLDSTALKALNRFVAGHEIIGAALCSVVPKVTRLANRTLKSRWGISALQLTASTVSGIGINYPKPHTIGPDRLANAMAVKHHYGAPSIVVDFGTAVTFDIVDRNGDYVGGVISPGLSAMTDYLHEKTALLPRIKIREARSAIGKNTEEAMIIGAVHGYRGLIQGILSELKRELKSDSLPVVATGGYASLMARRLPDITAVEPCLTLEGLRLLYAGQK
ncbi:MAG: type III pantothenate kinase [Pedosphaera sp.]|nr:type III pantothenate kinase [Pedosphaera sp.]